MENLIRHDLKLALETAKKTFNKPKFIVAAVSLPTGAVELITNTEQIESKIEYYLSAYDEEMRLKTKSEIFIKAVMVVF